MLYVDISVMDSSACLTLRVLTSHMIGRKWHHHPKVFMTRWMQKKEEEMTEIWGPKEKKERDGQTTNTTGYELRLV
jgi:hypothetical protein